jgi:hypothetical protein
MKITGPFITILALSTLSGCTRSHKKSVAEMTRDTTSRTTNINVVEYETPQTIDSSKYVIYPLLKEKSTEEEYGSSSSGRSATYWNLVFYSPETKEYHLLDSNRMIIHSYNAGSSSDGDHNGAKAGAADRFLYYTISITDFNHDGKLDDDDPEYLFISDKSGRNFKQVSPDNFNVIEWRIVPGTGKLIIQTRNDSNRDGKFDDDDEQVAFVYDLINGGKPEQVFSKDFELKTSKLYKKLWPGK